MARSTHTTSIGEAVYPLRLTTVNKGNTLGFALFIILSGVLFFRPAEWVPELIGLPIYHVVIIACMFASFPVLVQQLVLTNLSTHPITVGVLGMLISIILSHIAQMDLFTARYEGIQFLKNVVFYLLLVGLLDSADRIQQFLHWMLIFIAFLIGLSLLDWHNVIDFTFIDSANAGRLQAVGLFNNPNDLSHILTFGIIIALHILTGGTSRITRFLAIFPLALFLYAMVLTKSRGGFLGLIAAWLFFFQARFGTAKALIFCTALTPLVIIFFTGRQTDIDFADSGDTAYARLMLWAEAFGMLKENLFFGIGSNKFSDLMRLVTHNSFIQAFVELGFFGGTIFTGLYVLPIYVLNSKLMRCNLKNRHADLFRMRALLLSFTFGYITCMMASTRTYLVLSYIVPGLATALSNVMVRRLRYPPPVLNIKLLSRIVMASLLTFIAIRVFVKYYVRF